jgi:hypothetical protein
LNPPISRTAFVELIAKVGEHLAGNWDLIPNPEEWPMGAHLVDPSASASLYFCHHEGKIHVSSDLPKNAKGETPYVSGYGQLGKRMPSINVSFDKTPQQIAKNIERRLLPEYLSILEKAVKQIADSDAYYNKTENFAKEIAQVIGVEAQGNKVDFYRSEPASRDPKKVLKMRGEIEVHDDEVSLNLRLSYEVTKDVLEFLIRHR